MPYDKQSFLNGLAAGLTATSPVKFENRIIRKNYQVYPRPFLKIPLWESASVFSNDIYRIENPIYASKITIRSQYPASITYVCGEQNSIESDVRILSGSNEEQVLYHSYRFPIDYLVNNKESPNYYLNYVYRVEFAFDKGAYVSISSAYFDCLTVTGWIIEGFDANVSFGRANYPGDPRLITNWKDEVYYPPNASDYWGYHDDSWFNRM